MINVFRVDFNHDSSDKTGRFNQLVERLLASDVFVSAPVVDSEPVFSYSSGGRNQLDALVGRVGNQDAVVFLSDVCSYSFVLAQCDGDCSRVQPVSSAYESLAALRSRPLLVGYAADENLRLVNNDALLISFLPYGLLDAEAELPDADIVNIVQSLETDQGVVYGYRVRSPEEFFGRFPASDWPVYAFGESTCEVHLALDLYRKEALTEYLILNQAAFGTLNDNHQDDYFAVSYREPFWRAGDAELAFIA